MIYTVTFNPAIDCVMQVENLELGKVNRALSQDFYFGGKGVNVSCVLATRKSISLWTAEEAEALAERAMQLKTATEVHDLLQESAR